MKKILLKIIRRIIITITLLITLCLLVLVALVDLLLFIFKGVIESITDWFFTYYDNTIPIIKWFKSTW